ncbi:MAG: two-component regulator propeller domain-containing protein [Saprospiraceae bacterium]
MKNINPIYRWLILLFSSYGQLISQTSDVNFQTLTTSHGLSNNTIYSIAQDSVGFIWVGTKSGLNRFDGYEFKIFPITDVQGERKTNPTVFSLLKDNKGLIWMGLKDAGLVAYNPNLDKFHRFPFEDNATVDWTTITVKSIYEDSRNWLWIGTYGGGTIVLDANRKVIYHFCTYCNKEKKERLSNDFVFDFEEDENGNVYIATAEKGLNIFQAKTKSIHQLHASDKEDMQSFSKAICLDSTKTLWIGTEGNGLYAFDTKNKNWTTYRANDSKNGISNNIITDIQIDGQGQLWVATDGGGLNHFNRATNSFQQFHYDYTKANTLNTEALYDLHFDKSDNLWIGTFNGGLNILKSINPPFFTKREYNDEKALGLRSVLTVREDENGRAWLGTDGGGLFYFDINNESLELHNASKLLRKGQFNEVITCIQPIGNQGFWYGSFKNGLHFFDYEKGLIQAFIHEENNSQSLIHNNVWDLELDSAGGLWIGTLGGGIDYLPKGETTFQHFGNFDNQLSDVQVIDLLLDKGNKYLWIATENRGLNRLDIATRTIQQYQHNFKRENNLRSNTIHSLFEDQSGNIWIISDNGIDKLNPQNEVITKVSLNYQFQIGVINGLVEDKDGFIWLSTSTGIYRLNPKDNTITEFGTTQGVENNQFNPKASLQLSNGKIVFGGVDCFSVVQPTEVELNTNKTTPVFTNLKIFNQPIPIGDQEGRTILNKNLNDEGVEVRLSYLDREIVFEISTTEFIAPSRNKYAYKLEGYEDKWHFVNAHQRAISYSSLDGGNYQLQIKAANSSGIWNEEIRAIDIIVAPPFWEAAWFLFAMVIFVLAIILMIYRFLLNRQKEIYERQTLEQEQEILQLKNQNLEQEVTNKKSELNASILQMAHKNEFLTILKERIKKIQSISDISAKKPLRSIVNIINSELHQEDYWEKFQLIFNQTFQDFINQVEVKHPNLTQNDYRLSCFVKMKLNNREIASILNITVNGVEQAKYRLKKKIGLGQSENLNLYIQQFGKEEIL